MNPIKSEVRLNPEFLRVMRFTESFTDFESLNSILPPNDHLAYLPDNLILVQGYNLDGQRVCHAILSYDENGIEEPYNGERIKEFKYYLHWFQSEVEGQGYGRELINYLKTLKKHILLESLPDSIGFYLKTGCYLLSDYDLFWDGSKLFMTICQESDFQTLHNLFPYANESYIDKFGLTNYLTGYGDLPSYLTEVIGDILEVDPKTLNHDQILSVLF